MIVPAGVSKVDRDFGFGGLPARSRQFRGAFPNAAQADCGFAGSPSAKPILDDEEHLHSLGFGGLRLILGLVWVYPSLP